MQLGQRHSKNRQVAGFTLLEIVFVLSMIAILVTWLTVSLSTVESEQKLREAASRIELLAKRGLSIAVMQQRPYQLTITASSVSIAPRYALGPDEAGYIENEQDGAGGESGSFDDITASEAIDVDVSYEIKRWQSDDWVALEGDKRIVITLNPIGLIEPFMIRCTMGESWIMHELHPLTAGVRDEEMSIEKE
ncbi:prepilin-type N-terminal cleavage/methylation domain-containing protein [Akkermansiaceae bacterium]|jgi:prepilin-type N-terminal cleavage/methylation domain-containing protein|nr:prepilin-type N-terminal cleavage/methylation domain-containing protein [Akkermansiaceae bacterium]